jgi:hypothetical protein
MNQLKKRAGFGKQVKTKFSLQLIFYTFFLPKIVSAMGYVQFSMPRNLVTKFQQSGNLKNFIETGTFKGATAFWAAGVFEKVYTIEIDPERSRLTASQPGCPSNIEFLIGNSADVLPGLLKKVSGRSAFWLDGHWCNTSEEGKDNECPLMDELKSMVHLQDALIMIDDARAFLGPLPPPHQATHWPRIHEIFAFFAANFPAHFTTIADDVIYAIPPDLMPVFDADWISRYDQRFGVSRNWMQKISGIFKGK